MQTLTTPRCSSVPATDLSLGRKSRRPHSLSFWIATAGFDAEEWRVSFRDKLIPRERLPAWREAAQAAGQRVVVTNGCFDLLHLGHVTYLEAARQLGELLLVGVNGDASVRALKGAGRPLNSETDRALVLAALESVSAACVFPEVDAISFLRVARPDIYVKGGDYSLDTINQDERRFVEGYGGRVVVLGGVAGRSTSGLVARMGTM